DVDREERQSEVPEEDERVDDPDAPHEVPLLPVADLVRDDGVELLPREVIDEVVGHIDVPMRRKEPDEERVRSLLAPSVEEEHIADLKPVPRAGVEEALPHGFVRR